MAGLTAARCLLRAGCDVAVLDDGRSPGGRLATRELAGGARADSGAQFFTIRSELFAAAARGNQHARMVVARAARYMGMALISLTNIIDPEMFVIGGGVSRSWALVQPTILETLHSSPFIKPARRPRLRRARLGDRAGQVGAVEWARINQ